MTYFSRYGSPGEDITPEMLDVAEGKAHEMGKLRNSMRGFEANVIGFLGEELTLKILKNTTTHNTFQHDILWCPTFGGNVYNFTGEVKTKDRQPTMSSPDEKPRDPYGAPIVFHDSKYDHECSVTNFNPNQTADIYIFASLVRFGATYKRGFLIGYYGTDEYRQKSHFVKKGTKFATGVPNGITTNCHNMYHHDLHKFESGMLK